MNRPIDRSEQLLMHYNLYKISFIFKYVNIHELQLNYGGVDVWLKSLTLYSSFNVLWIWELCWQISVPLIAKMADHAMHQKTFAIVRMSSMATSVNTVFIYVSLYVIVIVNTTVYWWSKSAQTPRKTHYLSVTVACTAAGTRPVCLRTLIAPVSTYSKSTEYQLERRVASEDRVRHKLFSPT